jgi:hypothetical protein
VKTLTHCPKCHDPLLSTYIPEVGGSTAFWIKDCSTHLNHKFSSITSVMDENKLYDLEISITMIPCIYAVWYLQSQILHIRKSINKQDFYILTVPYFDPEPYINDYDKLINKIKIYMVMS